MGSWKRGGKSCGGVRKPGRWAWNLGRRGAEAKSLCLSRIRLQDFTSHIRKPVDAPVLILGFKRGKNQLSEQIETANVVIRESPSGSGRRLQHAQVLAPAAQRNQEGRASSYLAREVEFDASVGFTIVATKNAARCQAVLQKLGVADEAKATLDGERAGGRAAYHLRSFRLRSFRLQAFRQRDHDAVGLCDLLNPVADQLQHVVQDEAFGLEQVAIGGASRGRAPVPYLRVELRKGEQCAQRFVARDRLEDAVALLQRRPGIGRRRVFPVNSGWIGTHACTVRTTRNPSIHRIRGLTGRLIAAPDSTSQLHGCTFNRPSPANESHNSNRQRNSLFWGHAMVLCRPSPWCLGNPQPTPLKSGFRGTALQILRSAAIRPMVRQHPQKAVAGEVMDDGLEQGQPETLKKSNWS